MQPNIGYFAARVAPYTVGITAGVHLFNAMHYSTGLQIGQPWCMFVSGQPPAVARVKER
jgi:hypothetical protein